MRSRLARIIFRQLALLLAGSVAAVIWANTDLTGDEHAVHPLHVRVNNVGMAFFFALAAKEVFETLPGSRITSQSRSIDALLRV